MIRKYFLKMARNIFPETVVSKILIPWRRIYWWSRKRISLSKNTKVIAQRLNSSNSIKLELGSWKRKGMGDWIFSDLGGGGDIQLDLTNPIPFPDNTVDRIYSSHLLEHFSYPEPMLNLVAECHRILKPGGEFSIAVPNARLYVDAYLSDTPFERNLHCGFDVGLNYECRIDYINFVAYQGGEHKHLFDEKNLISILTEAGFDDPVSREFDPGIDVKDRRHNSIYAQALK